MLFISLYKAFFKSANLGSDSGVILMGRSFSGGVWLLPGVFLPVVGS